MPWIPRGIRDGIVTTRYPRARDGYDEGFAGAVAVEGAASSRDPAVMLAAQACPTQAIELRVDGARLDRARCILCGRCALHAPDTFRVDPRVETATVARAALVVPAPEEDDEAVAQVRQALAHRVRALGRSVHVRHVDAGSDGSDEWEVAALTNPVYDVQRLGIFFTASPKHADLLLVTGAGAAGMVEPLRETFAVMPEPKVVVAAGAEALSGGLFGSSYATRGGVGEVVPVDVFVPGAPATPFGLLYAILIGTGARGLAVRARRRART